jgi:hypothetical protein
MGVWPMFFPQKKSPVISERATDPGELNPVGFLFFCGAVFGWVAHKAPVTPWVLFCSAG